MSCCCIDSNFPLTQSPCPSSMGNPIQSSQVLNKYLFSEQTARPIQWAPRGCAKGLGLLLPPKMFVRPLQPTLVTASDPPRGPLRSNLTVIFLHSERPVSPCTGDLGACTTPSKIRPAPQTLSGSEAAVPTLCTPQMPLPPLPPLYHLCPSQV